MPIVRIEMLKGKDDEYKKIVLDEVHEALVEAFKIPDDDRLQMVYELERESFEIPPSKTGDFILIQLTVFKGRSYEAKKLLYALIVDKLERALNIKKTDILIVINEPPLENWGTRGLPASEVDMGFKIDV